jgi:3-oxoacyl-[acyl-carrier protein] reductase
MTDLKNKVALVTGSARGIGKAIAERFGALGASVVVNYATSEGPARETVAAITRLGATAMAVQADVAKVADIDRLFAATLERYSRVDIVVANAGLELVGKPIADVSESDYDRLFAVNTKGAFFTLQQAARHVADNGRIMYVGSSSTAFPRPGYGLYSGSKMAPRFFVEVLAKELGRRRVTVRVKRARTQHPLQHSPDTSSLPTSPPTPRGFVPLKWWADRGIECDDMNAHKSEAPTER